MQDEPDITETTDQNGILVRATCWNFGTDNEHFEYQYQLYCSSCSSTWWSGHHSFTRHKVCPACQERNIAANAEHNLRVRKRQKIILACIGVFFILPCVAAVVGGLLARLTRGG